MQFLSPLRFMAASVLLLVSAFAQAEVVVVVGASSPVTTLNADQVSQIFLGKASTFPGGQQAVPIDQPEGAAARDEFHNKVTNKAPAQLNAYWSKLIFSGKGQPPKQVEAAEVKKLIADNPNLIGYLDRSAVDSTLKIVYTP